MKKKVTGKDLTKEAPRSPHIRVGGYAILGRTIDKCRALVAGNIGEYHFDCPLDNMLFGFKGVNGADFKAQIEQGASDQEMVEWLNQSGGVRIQQGGSASPEDDAIAEGARSNQAAKPLLLCQRVEDNALHLVDLTS